MRRRVVGARIVEEVDAQKGDNEPGQQRDSIGISGGIESLKQDQGCDDGGSGKADVI